ncbi:MAG: peptidylprolyl isomerase [Oscillospiraceae bacterium]|nr:peptidylprolyl isomerase [Oscillospiraceae bacterium]MDY4105542.1 peptidylprolyl isomerase [Oscillospiraceae bacterium]
MSASSEKKRRQAEREQGIDKKATAQREAEEKKQQSKRRWTIGTILIVLLLVSIFVLNSTLPYHLTAVTVNGTSYSAGEMNYFYSNVYSQYGYYMSMMGVSADDVMDESTGETWGEYIKEVAVNNVTQIEGLYQEAVANGFTLSDEGRTSVEEYIASLPDYAENYGYSSVKKFLKAAYGTGVTEGMLEELALKQQLVSEYTQSIQDGFTYTNTELADYYAEHEAEYKTYDFLYYTVAAETEETTDDAGETVTTVVEGGLEAAKEAADTIAAGAVSEEAFDEAIDAWMEGETSDASTGVTESSINELYRDWVTASDRVAGDVTVVGDDSGYTVVMYQGCEDQRYPEVAVRHILIKTEDTDGDGTYSDAEKAEALSRIQEVEKAWNASAKTEDAFAELANEYSEDAGSNTTGGLYEGIYKGEMVTEFNDFCFAEGRQPGDTGIVYGQSSSYEGYHLIYFVGTGELHSNELARDALVSAAYSDWQSQVLENYSADTKFGMKLVG